MSSSMVSADEHLRFPIGRYEPPKAFTAEARSEWISEIEALPGNLRQAIAGLNEAQLDSPYRPGGWTLRQVVHHYPDSHLNSYARFRLALTESSPTIKPYDEAAWAELADAKSAPVEISLALLDGLHARWTTLLRSLSDEDYKRTMKHPEVGQISLNWTLGLYAWHSKHHVAHIRNARERADW